VGLQNLYTFLPSFRHEILLISVIIPLADRESSARLEKTFTGADEIVRVRRITPVARARNQGAKKASCDNLLFLDADMDLNGLDLKKLEGFDYDLGTAYYTSPVTDDAGIIATQNIYAMFGHPHAYAGGFMYVRRRVFFEVGGFRDVPLSDIEFGQRAWLMGYRVSSFPFLVTHCRRFKRQNILGTYFSGRGTPWGVP